MSKVFVFFFVVTVCCSSQLCLFQCYFKDLLIREKLFLFQILNI